MKDEKVERLVEEIMRYYHMSNYEEYASEELRKKYRKMIEEDKPTERIKSNGCRENV